MKLQRLWIRGFKSFCEEAMLSFPAGLTAIVGPNGCGKSNVSDALRWALGEQSVRSLRGEEGMRDVIFAGSSTRPLLGRAEVVVLFDNTQETAPTQYRGFHSLSVARRIYRSGESEYRINGAVCRLMDVRALLSGGEGAGRSYAIVEQGRIEALVSASIQDRRHLLEEAAGIAHYKSTRDAAARRLEQSRQNLARAGDLRGELERQEEALRGQVRGAQSYRALERQIEHLRWGLAQRRLAEAEQRVEVLERSEEALREEEMQREAHLHTCTEQLQERRRALAEAEAQRENAQATFSAARQAAQHAQGELALRRQACANEEEWLAQLLQEEQQDQVRRSELVRERESSHESVAQLEAALNQAAEEATALATLVNQHREELRAAQVQLASAREVHAAARTDEEALQARQTWLAQQQKEDAIRLERLHTRHKRWEEERTRLRAERDERTQRAQTAQQTQEALRKRCEIADLAQAAAERAKREQLAVHESETRTVLAQRARLEALREVLAQEEGEGAQTQRFLEWLDAHPEARAQLGVVGTLGTLIEATPALLERFAHGLAGILDWVVLRHAAAFDSLAAVLDQAEQHGDGVCFIALDDAVAQTQALPAEAVPLPLALAQTADRLSDCLRLRAPAQGMERAWFGHLRLLAEGATPQPRRNAHGEAWLARDGRMILGSRGEVTLGTPPQRAVQRLQQNQELETLEQRLREGETRQKTLAELLQVRDAELRVAIAEQNQLAQEWAEAREHAQRETQAREARTEALTRLEAQEQSWVQEEYEDAQAPQRNRAEWTRVEAALHARKAQRESLDTNLRSAEQAAESTRAAWNQAVEKQNAQRIREARLSQQLEHERAHAVRLNAEHQALQQRVEQAEQRRQGRLAQREAALRAITHWEANANKQEQHLRLCQENVQTRATEAQHVRQVRNEAETAAESARDMRNRLQEKRHAQALRFARERHLLEQCRREAEDLSAPPPAPPVDTQAPDVQALDAQAPDVQALDTQALDVQALDAQAPDVQALDAQALDVQTLDVQELRTALNAAERHLSTMQHVHLGAEEEYAVLRTRLEHLQGQEGDLQHAVENLERSIQRMNQESRARFLETFQSVNAHFRTLFVRMFSGGEGSLNLQGDDPLSAGVEIFARPPGKRTQQLSLLSGGEKALVAITLIFALFLHRPAPFCLLDEVDAPLDDANVERFLRLLQEMCAQTQCIVITHNKRTMQAARTLYGVTMEEAGSSKLLSVRLDEAERSVAPQSDPNPAQPAAETQLAETQPAETQPDARSIRATAAQ